MFPDSDFWGGLSDSGLPRLHWHPQLKRNLNTVAEAT